MYIWLYILYIYMYIYSVCNCEPYRQLQEIGLESQEGSRSSWWLGKKQFQNDVFVLYSRGEPKLPRVSSALLVYSYLIYLRTLRKRRARTTEVPNPKTWQPCTSWSLSIFQHHNASQLALNAVDHALACQWCHVFVSLRCHEDQLPFRRC